MVQSSVRGKGFSGRVFTTLFASGLLGVLGAGLPLTLRHEYLQDRLEKVRQTWPLAAARLGEFYSEVDRWQASDQTIDSKWKSQWEQALQQFHKSPLHDQQIVAAKDLESLLQNPAVQEKARAAEELGRLRQQSMESSDMKAFQSTEASFIQSQTDWLGQVTCFLFRFKPAPRWSEPQ